MIYSGHSGMYYSTVSKKAGLSVGRINRAGCFGTAMMVLKIHYLHYPDSCIIKNGSHSSVIEKEQKKGTSYTIVSSRS